ncbi:PREDICTED: uncharacterized protein LOC104587857 [Nelumbo nucifera]|uniref:Uncharacterized protein LOC104587857 n=1 Tax=Nelumbo nucifera TaxID=4432 RepID=A0A1U7Z082_NELNU|nr:PREDICTED: uncharacterized protein LOC104587857 [Nelumbo nucifera]
MVDPLQPAMNGNNFILVAIDYFTKWVEAMSIARPTMTKTVQFVKSTMIARYGAPCEIISNNGKNFVGKEVIDLCNHFKIKQLRELHYDPEIENIVHRLRKEAKQRRNQLASLPTPGVKSVAEIIEPSNHPEEEVMDNNEERTLRELAAPDLHQQPLCIEYADLVVPFELKSGLIHFLLFVDFQ